MQYVTQYDYQIDEGLLTESIMVAVDLPEQASRQDVYDLATGTLVESRDERQNATVYEYDDFNQVKRVIGPAPTQGAPSPTWIYTYQSGDLATVEDPRHSITSYTRGSTVGDFGITQPEATTGAGHAQSYVQFYRPEVLAYVVTTGAATRGYSYDLNGNLWEERADGVLQAQYEYDAQNRLQATTDPNGSVTSYSYDQRGQLTDIYGPADANGVRPHTAYAYDNAGRLTSVADPLNRVTTYQYDDVNRLVRTIGIVETVSYQYDANGNLRFEIHSPDSAGMQITERQYDAPTALRI